MPLVMFLIRFWGKVMTVLPMPTFAKYRFVPEFRLVQEEGLPQIAEQIDIARLLGRIKVGVRVFRTRSPMRWTS